MGLGIVISQPLCYNIVIQFIFYEDFPYFDKFRLPLRIVRVIGFLKVISYLKENKNDKTK